MKIMVRVCRIGNLVFCSGLSKGGFVVGAFFLHKDEI